jgi:hypothetical protein
MITIYLKRSFSGFDVLVGREENENPKCTAQ